MAIDGAKLDGPEILPTNLSASPLRVFVSYSRHDVAIADEIVEALKRNGFLPLIDRLDLPFGEQWQAEIADLIRTSDTVLWLVSPQSIKSKWCQWELQVVNELRRRLIPLIIHSVSLRALPAEIGRLHVLPPEGVFALDQHIGLLSEALKTNLAWIKEGTRLADRSYRWSSADRARDYLLHGRALLEAEEWQRLQPSTAPAPSPLLLDYLDACRTATTRALRMWLAGAAILATCALGLATWAMITERKAARNFRAAHAAVDTLVRDVAKGLRNVTGVSHGKLHDLLVRTEKVVRDLSESSSDDANLAHTYAALLRELAESHLVAGNTGSGRETITAALHMVDRVLSIRSDDVRFLNMRTDALHTLGDINRVHGRLSEALANYRDARDIRHRLANDLEGTPAAWRRVANSHDRIGDVLRTSSLFADAMREYEVAEGIKTAQLAVSSEPEAWEDDLSWTHNRIGDTLRENQDHHAWAMSLAAGAAVTAPYDVVKWQAALARYEKGLDIRRRILKAHPTISDHRRNLAWNLNQVGTASLGLQDVKRSIAFHKDALGELMQLHKSDMKNTEWTRDLALSHAYLGDAMIVMGDQDTAMTHYEVSLGYRAGLIETDADNMRWARDLFYARTRIADLAEQIGRLSVSKEQRRLARASVDRLLSAFPDDQVLARAVLAFRARATSQ